MKVTSISHFDPQTFDKAFAFQYFGGAYSPAGSIITYVAPIGESRTATDLHFQWELPGRDPFNGAAVNWLFLNALTKLPFAATFQQIEAFARNITVLHETTASQTTAHTITNYVMSRYDPLSDVTIGHVGICMQTDEKSLPHIISVDFTSIDVAMQYGVESFHRLASNLYTTKLDNLRDNI